MQGWLLQQSDNNRDLSSPGATSMTECRTAIEPAGSITTGLFGTRPEPSLARVLRARRFRFAMQRPGPPRPSHLLLQTERFHEIVEGLLRLRRGAFTDLPVDICVGQ